MKFPLALTLLLFFICPYGWATTFTVTSNADSGPGTLREAMQNAADNGTATPDLIVFNLPDITRAGRTITLLSNLPNLSSSLVIDGTTQTGAPFGISNARVQIQNDYAVTNFVCFLAFQVSNIEIYGLYCKGVSGWSALSFRQSNNIRMGAAGKGNVINGFSQTIISDYTSSTDPTSSDITFQGNLMGIDESGDFSDYSLLNYTTFYLRNVKNLQIGGLGSGEGNIICQRGMVMDLTCTRSEDFGYLRIHGNKIGTDRTGLIRIDPSGQGCSIYGYNDGDGSPVNGTHMEVEIFNNISNEPFELFKLHSFTIKGNSLGVGADNTTPINLPGSYMLALKFCEQGVIGGPGAGDKNYIANVVGSGVLVFDCANITISKNSFFCNLYGIDIGWILNRAKPFVTINTITASSVGGTSLPNSIIELFYDDECPGCEGKKYIGSATADNDGNWTYAVALTGAIVATATDTYGATSEFSSATINTNNVVVQDATCGKSNGSIKKVQVISGTDWHWEDDLGNIVGTNVDLLNVPSGNYKFVTSIGGNSCTTETILYQVKNIDKPIIDPAGIQVTQPTCGQHNGVLKYTASFDPSWTYQWVDAAGTVLSPDYSANNPFDHLAPLDYYLKVALTQDNSCFSQYGPFTLINQSGPTLDETSMQITNSTCSKSNGAIHNISYRNATGPIYTAWVDATGKIVGRNMDLIDVPAGKYRLKFKDGGGCDTIITDVYEIKDDGTISYDVSQMVIQPSSCKGNDGAVSGITSINATDFSWVNTATGNVIGRAEDLSNAEAGTYQLQFTNSYGCTATTNDIIVTRKNFQDNKVLDVTIWDASCDADNGYITISRFSADPSLYSFEWVDSATHTGLSQSTSIRDLSPGWYGLNATDVNGCTDRILTAQIKQLGKPIFDYSDLNVINDSCNTGTGAVLSLKMKDPLRSYDWVWYEGQQQSGNTPGMLEHLHAGSYYASVTDQYQCTVTSQPFTIANISYDPSPPQVADQDIPRNTFTVLTVANPQRGTYELLDNDLFGTTVLATSSSGILETPVITADRSFFVRFTRGECSSPLSKVNIKVFDSTRVFVPNAFTPNNDGRNDRWHIIIQGRLTTFNVSVFDRWGMLVYTSNNPASSWDGTMGGRLVSGTFTYIITGKDYFNKVIKLGGTVIVVR